MHGASLEMTLWKIGFSYTVTISETKTRGTQSAPGFVAINSSKSNPGDAVALVKGALYPMISMVKIQYKGVIALELSCSPGLRFVGIYKKLANTLHFR